MSYFPNALLEMSTATGHKNISLGIWKKVKDVQKKLKRQETWWVNILKLVKGYPLSTPQKISFSAYQMLCNFDRKCGTK